METKSLLAAIFYLLIGCHQMRVNGDTFELKYKANVFDDQYIGCVDKLTDDVMPRILRQEKANQQFDEAWRMANKVWTKTVSLHHLPDEFEDEHGIALLVFTNQFPEGNPIYKQLNANLSAISSVKDYLENFHFKALHFYLTRALQILKPDCKQSHVTFRGSRDTFKPSPIFKFGRFTSTSLNSTTAQTFGQESFFQISTCFGAVIGDFSFFPQEDEVLIPPTEKFTYVMKRNSTYILESSGQMCSYFNCAIMGGEKLTEAVCNSDSSKLKKMANMKKSKVSAPQSEQEERIAALEELIIRNHQEWDEHQEAFTRFTQQANRDIIYVYLELEVLKSQCKSSETRHVPHSELFLQTTNILNLLLKQELRSRGAEVEEQKEKLEAISTKMDAFLEFYWDTKYRLVGVEEARRTERSKLSDLRELISRTKDTTDVLKENIRSLTVSRDELQDSVRNIICLLTLIVAIGIVIWVKWVWR